MYDCAISLDPLVNIIMHGGDTQPWEVSLMSDEKTPYTADELTGVQCTLDILPFTQSAYLEDSSLDVPTLSKTGGISNDAYGNAIATFSFIPSDTMEMRGKYIYQLAVSRDGTMLRVNQGKLTVLPNVNRGAV